MSVQGDVQRDFLLSWWRIMHQRVSAMIQHFNQVDSLFFLYLLFDVSILANQFERSYHQRTGEKKPFQLSH